MVVLRGQLSNHGRKSPTPDRTQSRPPDPAAPPRVRNRGLSPAVIDEIVTAYLGGTTIRQICRDLDMHRTTVDNCLKRAGVKQPRRPVLSEADIDEAESAYLAGDSWAAIALRFDVDPATVGRLLRLRGVKMRPRRGRIRDPE